MKKSIEAAGLSRRDAAAYLAVSTRYLDILAARGELRRAKLGTKTVYLRTELDRLLESKLQPVRADEVSNADA